MDQKVPDTHTGYPGKLSPEKFTKKKIGVNFSQYHRLPEPFKENSCRMLIIYRRASSHKIKIGED